MDHHRLHQAEDAQHHIDRNRKYCVQIIDHTVKSERIDAVREYMIAVHLIDPVVMQHKVRRTIAVDMNSVEPIHI